MRAFVQPLLLNALLVCCCAGYADAQTAAWTQSYNLDATRLSRSEALLELSSASGVVIGFNEQLFGGNKTTVGKHFRQEKLAGILHGILEGVDVGWKLEGEQVLLFKKQPPDQTLSGFVEDATSGERLVGAFVYEQVSGRSVTTNNYGFFSLRVPAGKPAVLLVSMFGFQLTQLKVEAGRENRIVMPLQPVAPFLPELTVSGDSSEVRMKPFFSKMEDNLANLPIHRMPALGGETDLMRSAALLPGVESSIDGLGGWSIRGGDPDQNLVLIDDAVVFNPSHGLGLFSVFNPDIVRSARLWKGDAPVRLGGRASSALDVRTREGNLQQFSASASLSWMAARLAVEGPIVKDKGSFLLSFRRSLAGPVLDHFTRKKYEQTAEKLTTSYFFSDINLKTNWVFNTRNRVYLSLYQGRDRLSDERVSVYRDSSIGGEWPGQEYYFQYRTETNYDLKNRFASLRWNFLLSDNAFVNTTFTASRFNLKSNSTTFLSSDTYPELNGLSFAELSQSQLQDVSVKSDADWFKNDRLTLRTGVQVSWMQVLPFYYSGDNSMRPEPWIGFDSLGNPIVGDVVLQEKGLSVSTYGEAEWMPRPDVRVRGGLRAELYSSRGKTFFLPQPRLSLEKNWNNGLTASFSTGIMAQVLRTVSPNVLETTADLWLLANPALPPQKTWQSSVGMAKTWPGWTARAELYYKAMANIEEYNAEWFTVKDTVVWEEPVVDYVDGYRQWENEVSLGRGRSMGLECMLEKTTGRTTGWLSYTLARSDRQFDDLNNGQWFAARFDRRHHVKMAVIHRIGKHFSLSANGQFASGDAISTLFISLENARLIDLQTAGVQAIRLGYGDQRQPVQHRLDVGAAWEWQSKKWSQQISAGVYNVYNQSNRYYTYYTSPDGDLMLEQKINGLPLLPYVSWRGSF
ncbi:MAG: TonB-dependent receptor plug domain-containing protein [Saprospiraceae bacterium]|nr:TonB-dependent receptor plug domain-containing protein [Saprospiraceae bacterium]